MRPDRFHVRTDGAHEAECLRYGPDCDLSVARDTWYFLSGSDPRLSTVNTLGQECFVFRASRRQRRDDTRSHAGVVSFTLGKADALRLP
jgi:hypothetical protein